MAHIAKTFYKFLKDMGLSKSQAANHLGITYYHLHKVIEERTSPSLPLAYKIERYTCGKVDLRDFLKNVDAKTLPEILEQKIKNLK